MSDTSINHENKDRLFTFIFGSEQNKVWTLSLYNAINGVDCQPLLTHWGCGQNLGPDESQERRFWKCILTKIASEQLNYT